MKWRTLRVPGATLFFETRGNGPLLLLICGGNTDAEIFTHVADRLASDYTVVTYDPRGNPRIEEHSDDARRLLEAVGSGPAAVFGSSSGAIVGLDLVSRHPEMVRRLVAHEPPLVEVLPDAADWRAFFDQVNATYRREGSGPAIRHFAAGVGLGNGGPPPGATIPPEAAAMLSRMAANLDFFLEHEVRQFTRYIPDLPALDANRERIILAGGADSREHLPYRPAAWLAGRFGARVVDFPGDHAGYASRPIEFAAKLREVLA